ncbi:hypothetical protein EMIHUDRAFT_211457 [Emiliania huxleyi CCMP1516]|uniref:ATP-dependent DNA helicase n=2 Tax=Emiliania huxleyi TaxID=2903 RepID=A0A0D3IVM3_EMIH1|nr:hypothetical protein EMIHUDRAFT_211457 [Emiliania huxleyi CCMP1516]EOD15308.1 hypothetical protein EMIHUDRAFT_211457 [Emiliania huxleyi CCMP1516]|eukprot:XP_005767737.1 hypothetical protein EMIHUDRAFT_211457 [Emiliania huxleyi CCMP1516]
MEALAERQPARDIRSFFPGAATASTTARPPPPPVRSGGQPLAAAVRAGRLECLGIGPEDAAEIPADDADGADLPPPVPVDEAAAASWVYPTNMPVRPYQHSITKTALLHNTLVCLPTGMGKTLIAAAVMYNFSRWFPAGRCVFLAPTKPLVHQQVGAVRKSVGLPRELCAELTGQMAAEDRRRVWRFARFLFLTAQTFVNDLKTGVCPGEDVVCLVVDEAHKATSNHSYVQAARLLGRRSAGFRVLALSATPGSNAERMQEVVSNLRISRIEARDEQSVDVVGCLKSRQMDKVVVQPTAEYLAGRAAALEAYRALLRKLRESGVGVGDDPTKAHLTVAMMVYHEMLSKLAEGEAAGSHPKLSATAALLSHHFGAHPAGSRVMVFTSLRDSVVELTAHLAKVEGVRAFRFVGQASAKGSDETRKGLSQAQQREVVRAFRQGNYNVLVATSIGEEGLDIGEVDLIICYDVSSSAIRQTQRFGRTGRRNAGRVVMLVTRGVEEEVYERSLANASIMKRALAQAAARWALKEGDAPPRRLSLDRWTVGQARPAAASGRWASRGHVQDMSRTPLGHVP